MNRRELTSQERAAIEAWEAIVALLEDRKLVGTLYVPDEQGVAAIGQIHRILKSEWSTAKRAYAVLLSLPDLTAYCEYHCARAGVTRMLDGSFVLNDGMTVDASD